MRSSGSRIDDHRLEGGTLGVVTKVVRRDEFIGHPGPVLLLEAHEEGEVGVLFHVVNEAWSLAIDEEFGEDDVAHGHGEGTISTRVR